jgi:hypothetical protein
VREKTNGAREDERLDKKVAENKGEDERLNKKRARGRRTAQQKP